MTQKEFFTRYKFDRTKDLIGEGGFGNVYKGFDSVENELIALKIAEVKTGQEYVSLQKEVELASSLSRHVNIARYSACYRFDLTFGIFDFGILQYYPLGNLSQLVKNNKLTLEEKVQISEGIILGIQHLHKNNIIHRDLKSSNILIAKGYNSEYVPKIADFGLSKQFTEHDKSYFSNSFAGGSLHFVAPEQLEGKELRKNVDLWSLGIVLYELFVGKVPFKASVDDGSETARSEIIGKIKKARLPDEITSIPEPWQTIIRICLITDSTKRVKGIEDVINKVGMGVIQFDNTVLDSQKQDVEKNGKILLKTSSRWRYFFLGVFALIVIVTIILRYERPMTAQGAAKEIAASMINIAEGSFSMGCNCMQMDDKLGKKLYKYFGELVGAPSEEKLATKLQTDESFRRRFFNDFGETIGVYSYEKFNAAIIGSGVDCDSHEFPMHEVTLNSFWINKYEVTQEQWKAIMGNNTTSIKNCKRCPVEKVSFIDAQEFISNLNSLTGLGYRLPTEAEWEYAAKSNENYNYSGSDSLKSVAWYEDNSGDAIHPVGKKIQNDYGLHDMSGNVSEWCSDKYGPYTSSLKNNPRGSITGAGQVCRGGSYLEEARSCRVSNRTYNLRHSRDYGLGFRLAR